MNKIFKINYGIQSIDLIITPYFIRSDEMAAICQLSSVNNFTFKSVNHNITHANYTNTTNGNI